MVTLATQIKNHRTKTIDQMFHHSLDNILRKQICTNDASGKELAKAKKDNATIISDKSYESNINLCNPIQSEEPFEEGAPSTILRDLQELRPSNEKQDPSYSVYKHGNHIYHYGNLLVICASPMCKDEMYMGDARGRVVYANSPRLASSDWENDSKLYEVCNFPMTILDLKNAISICKYSLEHPNPPQKLIFSKNAKYLRANSGKVYKTVALLKKAAKALIVFTKNSKPLTKKKATKKK